jgi:hypothetical protein
VVVLPPGLAPGDLGAHRRTAVVDEVESVSDIDRLMAAMVRAEKVLQALREEYSPPKHCCPSCACAEYGPLCDAQARRRNWLVVLLRKRRAPSDDDLARAIEIGAWP